MYWLFELIYKHGDIERHPGPSVQPEPEQTKREDRQREETATKTGKGEKFTVEKWQEKWKRMMPKPARYKYLWKERTKARPLRYLIGCWRGNEQKTEKEEQSEHTYNEHEERAGEKTKENEHTRNTLKTGEREEKKIRQGERINKKEVEPRKPTWTDIKRELARIRKKLKHAEKQWNRSKRERKWGHITQTEKARRGRRIHKIRT